MPWALRSRAKRTVSSAVQPPSSSQSVAETRKNSGLSSGQTSRTASTTSRAKRVRFSYEPPYSSVRWLECGERKLPIR